MAELQSIIVFHGRHLLWYRPGHVAVDDFCGPGGSLYVLRILVRDENYLRSRVVFVLEETQRWLRWVGPLFDFIGKDGSLATARRKTRYRSSLLQYLFPVARRCIEQNGASWTASSISAFDRAVAWLVKRRVVTWVVGPRMSFFMRWCFYVTTGSTELSSSLRGCLFLHDVLIVTC